VATAIRRAVPGARITFLSSEYAAPVLQHHPDLDEVLTVTGHETLRELIGVFRRNFDVAIFLKPFRRLMLAAFLAGVPNRVATGYRWYSILANRRVYEHRSEFSKHESEYNVGLLRGLGLEPGPVVHPVLVLTAEERERASASLGEKSGPRVVLHPGGFAARRWQGYHYRDLADRLVSQGFHVVFTGSAAESERFQKETGTVPGEGQGMTDLMGRLSVRELMAIVGASQAVVSGATGPAHMAAALGVRTVSLFDPRRNNLPARWAPLGKGVVLRPDVPTCEKCIYEACPYWDCLDRLSVEDVAKQVRLTVERAEAMMVQHV
jgi:heptosyltransferase-2